jgi:hypothetical protein
VRNRKRKRMVEDRKRKEEGQKEKKGRIRERG